MVPMTQTAQSIEVDSPVGGFKVDTGNDFMDLVIAGGLVALGVMIWLACRRK